jgi:hypothetical protein
MTWAASSVSWAFSGSNITVVIDGSLASLPPAHQTRAAVAGAAAAAALPWCSFQFVLDGQASVAVTRPAAPVLTWTRQLAPGKHTLTITKINQAAGGSAWLQSVAVGGGTFLPPPQSPGQASGRRMLFMGDSYTAGSGSAGNSSCTNLAFENEDALRTYAMATARHFDADAQLLAWAGAGLNVPVRRWAGRGSAAHLSGWTRMVYHLLPVSQWSATLLHPEPAAHQQHHISLPASAPSAGRPAAGCSLLLRGRLCRRSWLSCSAGQMP